MFCNFFEKKKKKPKRFDVPEFFLPCLPWTVHILKTQNQYISENGLIRSQSKGGSERLNALQPKKIPQNRK